MAAALIGSTLYYFDPKFGEIGFGAKASFRRWFREAYYPKSFYTKLLGQEYALYRYALA